MSRLLEWIRYWLTYCSECGGKCKEWRRDLERKP